VGIDDAPKAPTTVSRCPASRAIHRSREHSERGTRGDTVSMGFGPPGPCFCLREAPGCGEPCATARPERLVGAVEIDKLKSGKRGLTRSRAVPAMRLRVTRICMMLMCS
jgi:hypothetical protein